MAEKRDDLALVSWDTVLWKPSPKPLWKPEIVERAWAMYEEYKKLYGSNAR